MNYKITNNQRVDMLVLLSVLIEICSTKAIKRSAKRTYKQLKELKGITK